MIILKGKDIPFLLQLIKTDANFEVNAIVKYSIYRSDGVTSIATNQSTTYNSTLKGYFSEFDVSTNWAGQELSHYILLWSISNAAGFPTTLTEELIVVPGVIEGTLNHEEVLRVILSALAGLSNGGGTPNVTFRDQADSKDRITATVDRRGNRTSITIDGS